MKVFTALFRLILSLTVRLIKEKLNKRLIRLIQFAEQMNSLLRHDKLCVYINLRLNRYGTLEE